MDCLDIPFHRSTTLDSCWTETEANIMDSDDYHDYVIRDGEFIGRFEEMYENCDNPWHQDEGGHLKEQIALLMLRDAGREYQSVLDLGCGKGRFTKLLIDAVGPELAMGRISHDRPECRLRPESKCRFRRS